MVDGIGKDSTQVARSFMKNTVWKRPEILDKLKAETDELHHRLQINKAFEGLTGDNPSINQYTRLLMKFLPFYREIEQKLAEVQDWEFVGFNFKEKRKSHLIEKDLKFLGLTDEKLQSIPACKEIPELNTIQQALGCMYVLEGSMLGAQLLAKNLNTHFGYDSDNGCAYLKCYGEGQSVGLKFREFANFLAKHSSCADESEIVNSAKATFESLDKWLLNV